MFGSGENFNQDKVDHNWNEGLTDRQARRVFNLNISASVIQAGSGLLIFFLTNSEKKYTVFTSFPESAPADVTTGPPFLEPFPEKIFSVGVGYLSAAFLFLSALDHLVVCTFGRKAYETGLDRGYNIFRWIEYSFSASLMRVIVGLLSGVVDLNMLILIFGHTAVTMIFGLIFELENSGKRFRTGEVQWYLYWLGFISHVFGWGTIIAYFVITASRGDAPGFVYAIVVIIFLLDLTFPIILGLQWRAKRLFEPYVNGEIAFIILSFTSKNALAWINFIGGNR